MKTILPHKAKHTVDVQNPQLAWWQVQIGHLSLADVIPAIVAEQRDILLQRFTPGTVNRYLAALSHVCTIAWREWQWLESNPVHAISKPREPPGRVRYLSDQERQRLLDACKISHNSWLYTIVVLALATGCRKMELLSLCWGDVDLQRGTLTLRDTKNGDTRRVPLVGPALDEMRRHARVRRLDTDLVFPSVDGAQLCSIRAAWDTARHQAELRDFRFHDLRHSCASYLAMSGASLLDIKTILGHKSIVMTQRYAHLSQDHTQQVLARMTAQML